MNIFRGILDFTRLNRNLYHMSESDIAKSQLKRLKHIVEYSRKHSPFYSALYKSLKIDNMDDFRALPVINKRIMMNNFDSLNTCGLKLSELTEYAVKKETDRDFLGYFKKKFVVGLSSGTSGSKGIYVTPKSLTSRLPFVFLARSGIPLKLLPFRILFMLRVFGQGFEDINSPFIKLKYLSTMTPPDEIVQRITEDGINVLMAPPSLLRTLLPQSEKINGRLKMIVSYAEVLCDEDKRNFTESFGAEVIQIYQASEGQIGSTCRCGNLHINEDLVFVEFYDEYWMPAESAARKMIVTNLVNKVQPLIRYEMNDLAVLGPKCPCGSKFRVLESILGRNDDVFMIKGNDGSTRPVFSDLLSRWIITAADGIREFKVIQSGEDALDIIIDAYPDSVDKTAVSVAIADRMRKEFTGLSFKIPAIRILFEKITLPDDMSKYKRFVKLSF